MKNGTVLWIYIEPRQSYQALKEAFSSSRLVDSIRLKAESNYGEGGSWAQRAQFLKGIDSICYSKAGEGEGGKGINVSILDNKHGSFEEIRVFNTGADSLASPELISYLSNLEDGKIIMMAVCYEATLKLTSEAIAAIESATGSIQIRNLQLNGSWAIIAIKGAGVPLAEGIDSTRWAYVMVEAVVDLDTDGDGIFNKDDADDDNDGVSDQDELAQGSDPLDNDSDDDGIVDGDDDNLFPPVLTTPEDITVKAGEPVDVTSLATDPDSNVLTFTVFGLPAGATFDTGTGRLYWETSSTGTGEYEIIVTVTDGEYYDHGSFTITVDGAWALNMTEMNWYENVSPYDSTGAAACQMILNYIREGAGEPLLTQDEIYEYAKSPGVFSGELDPDQVDKALGHFDPYDVLVSNSMDAYDGREDGNPYQGYNYTVDTYDPNSDPDAINNYMRDICHWMAYEVTKEEWWKKGELVARPNTPAALPIYGSYDNWVAVKGAVTSENPCPDPQNDPWNTPDFTVYGFWMKDPLVTGIGQNTYKTAAECAATYFLPLATGDKYDGLFLQVAEPPAKPSDALISIPRPIRDIANLKFVGAEAVIAPQAEGEMAGAGVMAMAASFSMTGNNSYNEIIKKESWRDIVDPYLLDDDEAVSAFEGSKMMEPILVRRLDEGGDDYYLVPFNKKRNLTSAVVILDAAEGYFKEASWTENPEILLTMSKTRAIYSIRRSESKRFYDRWRELIRKRNREGMRVLIRNYIRFRRSMRTADAALVWEPNGLSASPYRPYWQINISGHIWYVTQEREITGPSNNPPTISEIGDKRVEAGKTLRFYIETSDPDGDYVLSFTSNLPLGARLRRNNFTWRPSYRQTGEYKITISATDGYLTTSETIKITVVGVNRPPSVGRVSPYYSRTRTGQTRIIKSTYRDPNGYKDLKYGMLLINRTLSGKRGCYVRYNQDTNRLSLMNDAGTTWITTDDKGYPGIPGSNVILKNSYVELDCSRTEIKYPDTRTLEVNWALSFTRSFSRRLYYIYLYAKDLAGQRTGWKRRGWCRITR